MRLPSKADQVPSSSIRPTKVPGARNDQRPVRAFHTSRRRYPIAVAGALSDPLGALFAQMTAKLCPLSGRHRQAGVHRASALEESVDATKELSLGVVHRRAPRNVDPHVSQRAPQRVFRALPNLPPREQSSPRLGSCATSRIHSALRGPRGVVRKASSSNRTSVGIETAKLPLPSRLRSKSTPPGPAATRGTRPPVSVRRQCGSSRSRRG